MPSFLQIVSIAVTLAVTNAQGPGVIMKVQGPGSAPAGIGFQVKTSDSNDYNILNKTEIVDNITNECGRTIAMGNIDAGATTEDLIANKTGFTTATKGSKVVVTINQGNELGKGPYTCDVDLTSNSGGATGQTPLTLTEKDAGSTIELDITMPANLTCVGGSTGNFCTVRCYNPQNIGGCFAVQQTDITPTANTPATIKTKAATAAFFAQVAVDQRDFVMAMKAVGEAKDETEQGTLTASRLVESHLSDPKKSKRSVAFPFFA